MPSYQAKIPCRKKGCDVTNLYAYGYCRKHWRQKQHEEIPDRQSYKGRAPNDGRSKHQLYWTWKSMMRRCYDDTRIEYKDYGGRGIKVCKRWHDPFNFYEDMEKGYKNGMTLDRIDNDGDYCKDNCHWATAIEQANNKRNRTLHQNITEKERRKWAEEISSS